MLTPTVECVPDPKNPNYWNIALIIKIKSGNTQKPFLYEGEVQILGEVEVHDSFAGDKRELARVNGASLLYSAAREMMLNLSARSVHGPLCLPVLNFVEFFANDDQASQKAGKEPEKPTVPE